MHLCFPSPSLLCFAQGIQAAVGRGPRLLGCGLHSQESVWQPGQISPCSCDTSSYRGQGLRWSCPPLLCRAISRTSLQRPDQEHPPWSPL